LFDDFANEIIEGKNENKKDDLKTQINKVLDKDDEDLKCFEPTKKDKAGRGGSTGRKQRPLVVIGPVCSGKSTLIDYLKYNKPRYFEHIPNYTSKSDFLKSDIVDHDYKIAPDGDKFFTKENDVGQLPMWLFKYKTDQSNHSGLQMSNTGMYGTKGKKSYWTGSVFQEVLEAQSKRKIPIIECTDLKAARSIYAKGEVECNFVYVMPPSPEEIEIRLIRTRYGSETKQSLSNKIA
jgi:hypothetical protein